MGHSTTRAALIYQHRTSLRDKMIADEISRRAEAEHPRSGTQRARDDDRPRSGSPQVSVNVLRY